MEPSSESICCNLFEQSSMDMTRIRHFYGWYIVFCCFSMALFAWGLGFYGPGVYLLRLRQSQGWTTSSVSMALTFYNLLIAATVLHVGDMIQRVGTRPVVFAGSVVLGIGVALLPLVQAPWQLYLAVVPMAIGFAATNGASISVIIARWFEAKRGLALSLAFNGASAAGIVVTPLMLALTTRYGFATGLWFLVIAMLAVLWVVLLVFLRAQPEDLGLAVDGTAPAANSHLPPASLVTRTAIVSDTRFLTVTVAFSLGLAAQVGFQGGTRMYPRRPDRTRHPLQILWRACFAAGRLRSPCHRISPPAPSGLPDALALVPVDRRGRSAKAWTRFSCRMREHLPADRSFARFC
jgi:MFS family permease